LEIQNEELRHSQRELKAARDRYADLCDLASVGYVTLDGKGLIREISLTAARLLGKKGERLIGTSFVRRLAGEHTEPFWDHLRACIKGQQAATCEVNLEVGAGQAITVRLHSIPMEGPTGKGMFCSTAVLDISNRRRMEGNLRDSEAMFKDLFDAVGDVILMVDAEGNILAINRRAEDLTGYSHEQLMRSNVFRHLIVPDYWQRIAAVMSNLVAGKNQVYETRWRAKDGSIITFEGSSTPRMSSEGHFLSTRCILRDVTGRQRAEAALRESEVRFRAVFESAGIGIVVAAPGGAIWHANPAFQRMLGYTEAELRQMDTTAVTYPEDGERPLVRTVLSAENDVRRLEKRYLRKDGKAVWASLTVSVVRHPDGQPHFAVGMIENITKRKQTRESLRQAKEAAEAAAKVQVPALCGRILLAEDVPDVQRVVARTLREANLEVDVAEDGRVACEKAAQSRAEGRPYDLILMDIQMPVMDGFEATRQLRREGWQGPIVAFTAHAMVGDRQKCLAAGCDDYIAKPNYAEELGAILARYLPSNVAPISHRPSTRDELLAAFVRELPARAKAIEDALHQRDDQCLLRLTHKLKGTAAVFGCAEVADAAGLLHQQATAGAGPDQLQAALFALAKLCRQAAAGT